MKSITIHELVSKLYERIKENAKQQGLNLNKTIKNPLEKLLRIKNYDGSDHREDFMVFHGVLRAKEFTRGIK